MEKLRLGVSSCLLGDRVRYDGGHKYESWIVDTLGPYADFVSLCPESESGLPIPRETIDLMGSKDDYRVLTTNSRVDHSQRLQDWSLAAIKKLKEARLCGFILKSESPSCGMGLLKIYSLQGELLSETGVGIFARELMRAFPLLPIEEEVNLQDAALRENFIDRIFVMQRWWQLLDGPGKVGDMIRFHSNHKYLIMAHSPQHYHQMGKLVADIKSYDAQEFQNQYLKLLMTACAHQASAGNHQNVLLHILGYFKDDLAPSQKQEMLTLIDQYKDGAIPLTAPIALITHYVRKYNKGYLADQVYLNPHLMKLKICTHA